MTDPMTKSLRERVLEHFATLRIPLTAEQLDRVLTAPPTKRDRRGRSHDS